ncbi:hypothetical protein OVY01_13525 [Robbsia sp. Bb-Pol-6]|uniref:Uncharacterized protein n=1 Tax=Robbsia betulipollinis TaxID=2981849 RepID=A0ABT3ZNW6_9BURK|nr:hypothetical protein [Robbsia betulipollinis]MCY0388239.1 hypothetical protein [Robbsia betulipollinis]
MTTSTTVKARVSAMIDREMQRCARAMGDGAWEQHHEWVQAYLVTSAKVWLLEQSRKGAL